MVQVLINASAMFFADKLRNGNANGNEVAESQSTIK